MASGGYIDPRYLPRNPNFATPPPSFQYVPFNPAGTAATAGGLAQNVGNSDIAAQQAAAQAAADRSAAEKAAAASGAMANSDAESRRLAHENTLRMLMDLRRSAGAQQQSGIAALRRQLAQRGALDSGSLGAGVVNLSNHMSDLLTQGTSAANRDENSTLMQLLEASRNRNFTSNENQLNRDAQQNMMRQQMMWQALQQQYQQQQAQRDRGSNALSGLFNMGAQAGLNYLLPGAGAAAGGR